MRPTGNNFEIWKIPSFKTVTDYVISPAWIQEHVEHKSKPHNINRELEAEMSHVTLI